MPEDYGREQALEGLTPAEQNTMSAFASLIDSMQSMESIWRCLRGAYNMGCAAAAPKVEEPEQGADLPRRGPLAARLMWTGPVHELGLTGDKYLLWLDHKVKVGWVMWHRGLAGWRVMGYFNTPNDAKSPKTVVRSGLLMEEPAEVGVYATRNAAADALVAAVGMRVATPGWPRIGATPEELEE